MFKILTLNKISKVGLGQLSDNYTVSDNEANPDGILLRSFKMHDMELPESLKAVARRLRLSSCFRNSDDACAYGGGNLRGGFCYP